MITRNDYLKNGLLHRTYYAQFVTPQIKNLVEKRFGYLQLGRAVKIDESLNSIPLFAWDQLANRYVVNNWEIRALLNKANDGMTLAGAVCILKEAGRQVVEG
jgi:hypothetical protein